jgi:hypothetical protein
MKAERSGSSSGQPSDKIWVCLRPRPQQAVGFGRDFVRLWLELNQLSAAVDCVAEAIVAVAIARASRCAWTGSADNGSAISLASGVFPRYGIERTRRPTAWSPTLASHVIALGEAVLEPVDGSQMGRPLSIRN